MAIVRRSSHMLVCLTCSPSSVCFGANDIDGTVHKETILHDAGAKSPRALSEDNIIRIIKEAGRIPAACDCNFNILRIIE